MSKRIDLTGNKYGKLTVVGYSHTNKGFAFWECNCDCGGKNIVSGYSLRSGGTKSCGCNKPGFKNLKDLSGKRFGNLLVIERYGTASGRCPLWKTLCDCGKEHISRGSTLRNETSISCGCRMSFRKSEIERFWENVEKKESCWEWNGNILKNGYGTISVNDKSTYVHRLSYLIHKGEIPKGLLVCHTCDNRKCVNPEHFFLGNHKENFAGMINKDRHCRGKRSPNHKLNDEDIFKIRSLREEGKTYLEISKLFNVRPGSIRKIALRLSWKHI